MTPPQYIGGPCCGERVLDGVEAVRVLTDPKLCHYNPPRQVMGRYEYTRLGSGDYAFTGLLEPLPQADGVSG